MHRLSITQERLTRSGLQNIPADWDVVPLGLLCKSQYGLSLSSVDDGATPMIGMQHLVRGYVNSVGAKRITLNDETLRAYTLKQDDVLFNRTNSFDQVGKTAIVVSNNSEPTVFASYLIRLNFNTLAHPAFITQFMNYVGTVQRIKSLATPGVSQFNINPSELLKRLLVPLPSLNEQRSIAAVLIRWDRAMQSSERLLKLKRRLRRCLTQQLLTGRRRFPQFVNQPLQRVRLSDVMNKVTEPISPLPDEMYRQIGVRSHGKGLFHKSAVTGASLGSKRVFRVIPGCLTLNIIFAWERALAMTTEREAGMIASHRFPMFRPDASRFLAEYALLYFLSDLGVHALKLASPGGAGRNRTLNQDAFLKTPISLPPLTEQQRIVAAVATADREIDLREQQLAALREQKKGLMQKLLTGQIRLLNEKHLQERN